MRCLRKCVLLAFFSNYLLVCLSFHDVVLLLGISDNFGYHRILFNRLLKTKSPQCEEMRYPGYFFMLQLSQLHLNKNNLLSHVDLILEKLDE